MNSEIKNNLTIENYIEILDHSNDGINIIDIDGKILYANKISADYVGSTIQNMHGQNVTKFYPNAVLLNVLKNKKPVLEEKIHTVNGKKYIVNCYPLYINNKFYGAYSIFKNIKEIDMLSKKIKALELQFSLNKPESNISNIIGSNGSLENVLNRAKRIVGSIGGARHSIITGESGTGKTMLANLIYQYACSIGVLSKGAPFIEVNCAQFTNSDIAASEIFGSEIGAYTGAITKKGLLEEANGGVLFLDEAHTLQNYQNILLKAIESGKIRRLGGTKEINVNVIIIAASTKDLKNVLLPELYQRLGQYEIYMPSLSERNLEEKKKLLDYFIKKYENEVYKQRNIKYKVNLTAEAQHSLLYANYPRNIRQFRDVINYSIDSASPLIEDIKNLEQIESTITINDLPSTIILNGNMDNNKKMITSYNSDLIIAKKFKNNSILEKEIIRLYNLNYGARRIANILTEQGQDIKYYQVSYILKKHKNNSTNNNI